MTPEQLRLQAEKRAAAATPSGVLRSAPTNQQIIKGAKEEISNQQEIENAKNFAANKAAQEQEELASLGLAASPVAPQAPVSGPVSASDIVQNPAQQRQVAALETPTIQQAPSAMGQAQSLISQGTAEGQKASQDYIAATDTAMSEIEKQQAKLLEDRANAEKEGLEKIRLTEEEEKKFRPDDRSVWTKASTGQKIALLVGGFLSSMTPQSAQAFRDGIQKNIDRDNELEAIEMERLKGKTAAARSEFDKLEQRFGSKEAAMLARSNQKLASIAQKLQVTSQTAQSKIVAANALAGLENVKSAMDLNKAKLIQEYQKNFGQKIPGYENSIQDKTKKAKFEQSLSQKIALDSTLNDLEKLVAGTGEAIPFTEKNDRARQLVQDAQLQMKEVKKLGVLSGDDAKRLDDYISNPSLFKSDSRMMASIKGMKDLANKAISSQEIAYGLKRQGSTIGRTK